ncbi:hypothetical protein BZA05DRAFT_389930, partial [Tricharina praecox]|uniref:uncharacterized protein n=1 Tax=Tricharina praecox TaxID=43433 RepID=UPI0022201AA4
LFLLFRGVCFGVLLECSCFSVASVLEFSWNVLAFPLAPVVAFSWNVLLFRGGFCVAFSFFLPLGLHPFTPPHSLH